MNFTASLKKPDFKTAPARPPRRATAAGDFAGGVGGAACWCRGAGGDAASLAGSPPRVPAGWAFIPAGSAPAFPWASQQRAGAAQAGGKHPALQGRRDPRAPIPAFSREIQAVQAVQSSAAQP